MKKISWRFLARQQKINDPDSKYKMWCPKYYFLYLARVRSRLINGYFCKSFPWIIRIKVISSRIGKSFLFSVFLETINTTISTIRHSEKKYTCRTRSQSVQIKNAAVLIYIIILNILCHHARQLRTISSTFRQTAIQRVWLNCRRREYRGPDQSPFIGSRVIRNLIALID